MFDRLGIFVVRRRRWIVGATILFAVLAGAIGGGVAERLSNGGFDDPDAEAVRAAHALQDQFGVANPNFVLLVTVPGSVDDPAGKQAGLALTEELTAEEGVGQVLSYWTTGIPAFKSEDGTKAL